MPSGEFLGGVLLAGVLATAGVAKLADLDGSRNALGAFGVPRPLAAPLGSLLPIAELATAGLLVAGMAQSGSEPGGLLLAGALSAFILLALFCAGIAFSLVRGRAPDCHCFGQLHSAPASSQTLARNGALLTLAAFVASGGDLAWTVAAGAAALVTLGIVVAMSSRGGRVEAGRLAADRGLPLGAPAPAFELPSLDGPTVSLTALRRAGRPVLLVFTDPQCGPCLALAPDVATWQRRHAEELTIAVLESRDGESAPAADEHGRDNVLFQRDSEVAEAYRASGTPTAVLVGPEGEVASPVAGGAMEIEALVAGKVSGFESGSPALERRPVRNGAGERNGGWMRRPLIRRELLARAGAWAGASAFLAAPLRAGAAPGTDRARCNKPEEKRCGDQCCDGALREECGENNRGNKRCVCREAWPDRCGRAGCVRTASDDLHCGDCNDPCPAGTACVDKQCVGGDGSTCTGSEAEFIASVNGWVCCDGHVSSLDEAHNCGSCGNQCTGKRPACCFRRCSDLHGDPDNCGECGKHCGKKQGCYKGKCVDDCPPGLAKCRSGRLSTCYQRSSEICCGGKVVSKEGYTNPKCCGDEIVDHEEGDWFCP